MLTLLILSFGGQSSTDMPFLLVSIQNFTNLHVKRSIAFRQSNLKVLVDRGFGYSKVTCSGANSRSIFDDVHSQFADSLLDGICHSYPSDAVFCQQNLCPEKVTHDKIKRKNKTFISGLDFFVFIRYNENRKT